MRVAAVLLSLALCSCGTASRNETDRLASLLQWAPGSVVADVGAGTGEVAKAAAAAAGPSGLVYATEVDPVKLRQLKKLELDYKNVKVVAGSTDSVGLRPACCDSIVLRGVYHHLTKPALIDAGLFRALRPGGRLAVIDFTPRRLLSWLFPVHGAPNNRSGHGVTQAVVVNELRQAGFVIATEFAQWPGGQYCIIGTKPGSASNISTIPSARAETLLKKQFNQEPR